MLPGLWCRLPQAPFSEGAYVLRDSENIETAAGSSIARKVSPPLLSVSDLQKPTSVLVMPNMHASHNCDNTRRDPWPSVCFMSGKMGAKRGLTDCLHGINIWFVCGWHWHQLINTACCSLQAPSAGGKLRQQAQRQWPRRPRQQQPRRSLRLPLLLVNH